MWGREYWYVCACIALGGRRMIGSFSDVRGECGCLHVLSCVCVCVCVAGEADGWERAKRTSCHCGSTNWRCCDLCAGVVCYPHPHASEHAWCTIEVRAWARTPTTFTSLPPFAYTHAQTISFPCVTLDFGVCLCVCVFCANPAPRDSIGCPELEAFRVISWVYCVIRRYSNFACNVCVLACALVMHAECVWVYARMCVTALICDKWWIHMWHAACSCVRAAQAFTHWCRRARGHAAVEGSSYSQQKSTDPNRQGPKRPLTDPNRHKQTQTDTNRHKQTQTDPNRPLADTNNLTETDINSLILSVTNRPKKSQTDSKRHHDTAARPRALVTFWPKHAEL